jgi:recombination protein RecT
VIETNIFYHKNILKMANEVNNVPAVKGIFEREDVKQKIAEMMGEGANAFITSLLSIVSNNSLLKKTSPHSIYHAAMTAAALNLPINPNLGYAWIVPYKNDAQFQLGARGYVQLAQRTG